MSKRARLIEGQQEERLGASASADSVLGQSEAPSKVADKDKAKPAKKNFARDELRRLKRIRGSFEPDPDHYETRKRHHEVVTKLYERQVWDGPPTVGGGVSITGFSAEGGNYHFGPNEQLEALLNRDDAEVACFECGRASRIRFHKCHQCGVFVCKECGLDRCNTYRCKPSLALRGSFYLVPDDPDCRCKGCGGTIKCPTCKYSVCYACREYSIVLYEPKYFDHSCEEWQ